MRAYCAAEKGASQLKALPPRPAAGLYLSEIFAYSTTPFYHTKSVNWNVKVRNHLFLINFDVLPMLM